MKSFHNDQAIKDKCLVQIREAGKFIQGVPSRGAVASIIGCYDIWQYPEKLGLPVWLAVIQETIFDNMSAQKSLVWPEKFIKAIPVGLTEQEFETKVKAPFLYFLAESVLEYVVYDDVKRVVTEAANLWKLNNGVAENREAVMKEAQSLWDTLEIGVLSEASRTAAWVAEGVVGVSLISAARTAAWSCSDPEILAARFDYFADTVLKLLIESGR